MSHKCFISFKTEDFFYKKYIQENMDIDMIDKSLDYSIDSSDQEHIMRRIREDHLHDSTVTIFLIGSKSAENLGESEQKYIKRELQASLYHGVGNTQNGILGVVLPSVTDKIYCGQYYCSTCGRNHNWVKLNNDTVITEFSYNYYIPNGKCAHGEDDRFCVLVRWEEFKLNPEFYIEQAFSKRSQPIANKTRVRP
ncbi:TIR domain-containing protein [Pararcticibacter amylolyticus]|uniref:Molecular chaperone Tir n=1 Tax=Pararcticibacter amylolyticus TaxID=2173175 RepID=A0A2U2PIX1_9SPHI|nr:TIR domain-containing protein [Pararcticibacter amylolyticus]PWG81348.1 molecular chaperone Tir [Pararcticibacter amylolyticus]